MALASPTLESKAGGITELITCRPEAWSSVYFATKQILHLSGDPAAVGVGWVGERRSQQR